MNERRKVGIQWHKSCANFAGVIWAMGTYLGLLIGAMWLACKFAKGDHCERASAAYMGVVLATVLHWLVFCLIERGHQEHANNE